MPPSWGANAILHPQRRPLTRQPARPFDAVDLDGAGVKLKGWWFHAAERRGTLVYLHGVADNRGTSVGIAVPNAGHNHVIDAQIWRDIDGWLDTALAGARAP